jgi:hypothetical protein
MAALCVGLWAIVAYQRWQTKAHTLSEVALGSIMGVRNGKLYSDVRGEGVFRGLGWG